MEGHSVAEMVVLRLKKVHFQLSSMVKSSVMYECVFLKLPVKSKTAYKVVNRFVLFTGRV